MPQITGYMTADERSRFGDYAHRLGLDGGTVATLLLVRELRVDRLAELRSKPGFRSPAKAPGKITSHRLAEPEKQKFREHRARFKMSASKALGLLCRAELKERWLEKAIHRK